MRSLRVPQYGNTPDRKLSERGSFLLLIFSVQEPEEELLLTQKELEGVWSIQELKRSRPDRGFEI